MNAKIIAKTFQPVYDQPCWGLRHGQYTNLSMNFGKPSLHVREPFDTDSKSEAVRRTAARRQVTVRGEWWLWIWSCYWRLSSNGQSEEVFQFLKPYPDEEMQAYPVNTLVNKPSNDSPKCIEPLAS